MNCVSPRVLMQLPIYLFTSITKPNFTGFHSGSTQSLGNLNGPTSPNACERLRLSFSSSRYFRIALGTVLEAEHSILSLGRVYRDNPLSCRCLYRPSWPSMIMTDSEIPFD